MIDNADKKRDVGLGVAQKEEEGAVGDEINFGRLELRRQGGHFQRNFGDSGGFGALLVDFDFSAVLGVFDFEGRAVDDVKEFCAAGERIFNAHCFKIINEIIRNVKFKLWKADDDFSIEGGRSFEGVEEIGAVVGRKLLPAFSDVKCVVVGGQNHEHSGVALPVGELDSFEVVVFVISEAVLENFAHHVDFVGGAVEIFEVALMGIDCREGESPVAFEVDDV